MKQIFTLLCLAALLFSCGSSKRVVTQKKNKVVVTENGETKIETVIVEVPEPTKEITIKETAEVYASPTEEYIAIFSDIAKDEMVKYGVPALVKNVSVNIKMLSILLETIHYF